MAVRSLNKASLIGNLTRDPELRYTPNGTAVCTFTVATNREWTIESGEKREEAEFTRCVSWNKLAELCSQLLSKGRKVYVEGRLQTRSWTSQDGQQRMTTEVVINDMIVLDSRRPVESSSSEVSQVSKPAAPSTAGQVKKTKKESKNKTEKSEVEVKAEVKDLPTARLPDGQGRQEEKSQNSEEVNPDDIPF